jgi:RNA polymerase sigma-32 factor
MAAIAADSGFARYRTQVARFDTLSHEQEAELARAFRAGDQRAGARLVEANLKFVVGIAQEYRRWGTPLDDLVQQGNIGLLKAAERFDPSQPNSLRTYAAYWIRAEIRDYVVRCYRIVRLGTTRTERRALRAFRSSAVGSVDELVRASGMPEARCRLLWPLLSGGDRSLDFSYQGAGPARDMLSDGRPDPEHVFAQREAIEQQRVQVQSALDHLSTRELDIVRARLMTEDPITLEQLGRKLGVSRERVRQLESRAKAKIREALVV